MTTHEQKAIELALEGFKLIDLYKLQPDSVQSFVNHYTWHIKQTLKKVEPEQKQEPVAWLSKGGKGIWFHKPDESLGAIPLYAEQQRCPNCDSLERQNAELDLRLAEQDQAPFGFLTNKRQRFNFEPNATGLSNMPMTIDWKIPLYGSPQPQRTWVGLTDDEVNELVEHTECEDYYGLVEATEAKLKEKNT